MSLIDKLEDLVVKVDTEYQEKMEAVIREIVPGMPEGNVRHAAECMCTDRMGSMMDIDIYILKEEDRPYECHYLKDLLEDRVASPAWYRAAVEFQGRPEQERLAFCSWCCCHGGCNLCMDISKYNIKGLKIYGG